jgi:hypothetical protein
MNKSEILDSSTINKTNWGHLTYGTHSIEIQERDDFSFIIVVACEACKSYSSVRVDKGAFGYSDLDNLVGMMKIEVHNTYLHFRRSFHEDCQYQKDLNIVRHIHTT